jgi:hypothetical protein
MRELTTWRKEIAEEMKARGDDWANIEAATLSDAELDVEFDCGFGGSEGVPFTLWTRTRVYFPIVYDGAEWCGSVARHPDGAPTHHFGGQ